MRMANVLYYEWDEDAQQERDGLDEISEIVPSSSSFTAINHRQSGLVNNQPSSPLHDPVCKSTNSTHRRRNPAVAHYLGLGYSKEPAHLDRYAPLPDGLRSPPPEPAKQRRKLRTVENVPHSTSVHSTLPNASKQRCAIDALKSTKLPRSRTSLKPSRRVQSHPKSRSIASNIAASDVALWNSPQVRDDSSASTIHHSSDAPLYCQPASSDLSLDIGIDTDFDDDLDDEDFLKLTSDMINAGGSVRNFSCPPCKGGPVDGGERDEHPPAYSLQSLEDDHTTKTPRRKKFVSPITLTTRLLAATGDIDCKEARKPIVRSPFPTTVRDRSPIIGLSSDTVLRTCFRIGEAINQAHQSSKSGKSTIFELYARILESERVETKQLFTFADLFHGKPPYIKATYEAALWKSVQLFDYDSKRLLQQGRICRCMGTMTRNGREWVMTVLNIWEATWDDIKWVEGIVNFR